MSWFNLYVKQRPIKETFYNWETKKVEEIIIGWEKYFDKDEFVYYQKWEEKARENRGKYIKFYDDFTNEELSTSEIKALENLIIIGEKYVYIPIDDGDLQAQLIPEQKPKKQSKRKYKSRLPISIDLRKAVYQLFDSACRSCGNKHANQIHHIDGDPSNNHIKNLELLCYDCHLSTEGKVLFSRKINED